MARRSRFAWSRWLVGALGVGFAYLAWMYLTLPDVRVLATTNPETTAFIEIRRDEAHDAGRASRCVGAGCRTTGSRII